MPEPRSPEIEIFISDNELFQISIQMIDYFSQCIISDIELFYIMNYLPEVVAPEPEEGDDKDDPQEPM